MFFSEAEVDEGTLTAATNALKAEGVSVEINDVDPIVELGTIEGVDSSTLESFKAEAAAAAATMPPSPPPPPDLIKDDDDHASTPLSVFLLLMMTTVEY